MTIAIDFDETLFATLEKVIEIYNKRNGAELSLSQITAYNLFECLPSDVAEQLIELFEDKTVYDFLRPYNGAVRAVQSFVNNGHEVYIATATSSKNLEWKEQLLKRYFPFVPQENLIRIHNKKLLNCDIMIEDNLDTLVKTLTADRVCFNQPWNNSTSKDFVYDIHRFSDWNEINDVISEIERRSKEWETNNV